MIVKKTGRLILGAKLSKDEEKAMKIEIQKQLADYIQKNTNELDAIVLWYLHKEFGFVKKRLRKFYDLFNPALDSLCKRYEITDKSEELWLFQEELKNYGVDLDEWNSESA